ncbi:MAG: ribosome silencing factor [Phycisphaerales bacterium]|nr:ribosome silencing factor [Phycisphaerales bacterium]
MTRAPRGAKKPVEGSVAPATAAPAVKPGKAGAVPAAVAVAAAVPGTQALRRPPTGRAFAVSAAAALQEDKCEDVVVFDVTGVSSVADFVVIASGTSDRQMRTCVQHIKEKAEQIGQPVMRSSLDDRTTWAVMDCSDVMVHVFEPNTRAYYDLESMWEEAARVDWATEHEAARVAEPAAGGTGNAGGRRRRTGK